MTFTELVTYHTRLDAEVGVLQDTIERLEATLAEHESQRAANDRGAVILTGLSDAAMEGFCGALTEVANHIIGATFGAGHEVFIEPVGTTGMRVKVRFGDLEDTVEDSQGEGFKSIVSLALLLAATSLATGTTLHNDFICFDEPFPGVRGDDRLDSLYEWLRSAANELGIQLIIVSLHEQALTHADNIIELGASDA